MLELIYSPDWRVLSAYGRAQLMANAERGQAGQVLVVPEQFSFETERALCAEGGAQISRFAEVLSFSRLAERSLAVCGGIAHPVMDQGGRIMALAEAVEQVRPQLKFYANSALRADFLLQMSDMVDELKCYGIDSAQLHSAAAQLDGALAQKTQELSLLLEAYETLCARSMHDPRDRLQALCDHIRLRGFGRALRLYVDGFFGFTALERNILSAFLAQDVDVTVLLCCDDLYDGAPVFAAVRKTVRALLHEADLCGAAVRAEALAAAPSIALSAFTRERTESDGLTLYTCDAASAEVEAICADILAYVRAGGRYRDIAIACADPEGMRPLLRSALARCEIPAYFSEKQPALQTPLLGAVIRALRAAAGQMEQEDVLAWLKSDCSPLTQDECDQLERYVFLWDISGARWCREWTQHPIGFTCNFSDADREALAAYNVLRQRAISPLIALRDALSQRQTVGAQVLAIYDFLEQIEFSRRISERLAQLEQAGELQTAQVMRQLYELLIGALEQLYAVLHDAVRTPEQLIRLMEILLTQYQVGTIPAVMDAVTVGEPAALQHRSCTQLYVCGINDDNFPKRAGGGSLLNEPERERLRRAGICLAPDENEQMDRAMVSAYALLCAPQQRLCISSGSEPYAYLFSTLCKLYPECVRSSSAALPSHFATARTLGLWLAQQRAPLAAPAEALAYCDRLQKAAGYTFGILPAPVVQALYGTTLRLSPSRIDRYAACRFAFFLNDGLKAAERKQASFDAPGYGTFVHHVLEHTLADVKARGGIAQVDDAALRALARVHMEDFLHREIEPMQLEDTRFSYLFRRNFAEIEQVVSILGDELRSSRFTPTDFELKFSNDADATLPPITLETPHHRVQISGTVDRVDLYDSGEHTFFRVVDYKTGKKSFDYTEILERRGLQMLLYLFALRKHGEAYYGRPLHPAGVLYVPARDALLALPQRPASEAAAQAERRKAHHRQGLLLDDPMLMAAMGDMPCKTRRDGSFENGMDLGQLAMLERYVNREIGALAEEIYGGTLQPNPYVRGASGACSYCPYHAVCHLDLCDIRPRSLKATKAQEFWARLAQEEEQHG